LMWHADSNPAIQKDAKIGESAPVWCGGTRGKFLSPDRKFSVSIRKKEPSIGV